MTAKSRDLTVTHRTARATVSPSSNSNAPALDTRSSHSPRSPRVGGCTARCSLTGRALRPVAIREHDEQWGCRAARTRTTRRTAPVHRHGERGGPEHRDRRNHRSAGRSVGRIGDRSRPCSSPWRSRSLLATVGVDIDLDVIVVSGREMPDAVEAETARTRRWSRPVSSGSSTTTPCSTSRPPSISVLPRPRRPAADAQRRHRGHRHRLVRSCTAAAPAPGVRRRWGSGCCSPMARCNTPGTPTARRSITSASACPGTATVARASFAIAARSPG